MRVNNQKQNVVFFGFSYAHRFIVGEVVAAVSTLHELGFSYGDLKPENVLITEIGHIKVSNTLFFMKHSMHTNYVLSQIDPHEFELI